LLPNGTVVEILEGSGTADGYRWIRLRAPDGEIGWMVSQAVQQQ
jgi:hypothetical protein